MDVEPAVVASTKSSVVPKAMGSVDSTLKPGFEKLGFDSGTVSIDNPKSNKTLGQYSMNVVDKSIVDKSIVYKSICVLISQILGIESEF